MGMVNLILIVRVESIADRENVYVDSNALQVESIRSLATRESDDETNEIYIPALVAVGIAFCEHIRLDRRPYLCID